MKSWEELPKPVLETMSFLGSFRPLIQKDLKAIKGWINSDETYIDVDELRDMAEHLCQVADWLEDRAFNYSAERIYSCTSCQTPLHLPGLCRACRLPNPGDHRAEGSGASDCWADPDNNEKQS